jgi:hypothetical protein
MKLDSTATSPMDPEATANGEPVFAGLAAAGRQVVSPEELCARLTALIRSCDGCENVSVIQVDKLDIVDRKDGCNWSLALVLDPAGVEPEVYALGYGAIIHLARASWNLKDAGASGSAASRLEPDFEL